MVANSGPWLLKCGLVILMISVAILGAAAFSLMHLHGPIENGCPCTACTVARGIYRGVNFIWT